MNASPLRMSACGWSSPEVPESSSSKRGSTKLTWGSVPAAQSAKNVVTGRLIGMYFAPHSARNGHVAEVVAAAESGGGQAVPDRRQRAQRRRVGEAVGLRGVLVDAVGIGLGQRRGEVARERRPLRHRLSEERPGPPCGSSRSRRCRWRRRAATRRARPPLYSTRPPVAEWSGSGCPQPWKSGARAWVGWRCSGAVAVGQAGLAPVGSRQPAEEVVEGAVLEHHDHDVVDSRASCSLRSPRSVAARPARARRRSAPRARSPRRRGAGDARGGDRARRRRSSRGEDVGAEGAQAGGRGVAEVREPEGVLDRAQQAVVVVLDAGGRPGP